MRHIKKYNESMKKINLLGKDMLITKEYEVAVCVWETVGSNLENYEDVKITLGQKVYNVKILETGSIVFTLTPDSESYIVTIFPQMFGFLDDDQLAEIKRLQDVISDSQTQINKIYASIERTGYTDLPS